MKRAFFVMQAGQFITVYCDLHFTFGIVPVTPANKVFL